MNDNSPSSHDVYMELTKLLPKLIPNLCGIEVRKIINVMYKAIEYSIRVSNNDQLMYLMSHMYTYEALERGYEINIDYKKLAAEIAEKVNSGKGSVV